MTWKELIQDLMKMDANKLNEEACFVSRDKSSPDIFPIEVYKQRENTTFLVKPGSFYITAYIPKK